MTDHNDTEDSYAFAFGTINLIVVLWLGVSWFLHEIIIMINPDGNHVIAMLLSVIMAVIIVLWIMRILIIYSIETDSREE